MMGNLYMSYDYLPRDTKLKKQSAELRANATKEENHLWYDYLRTYPVRFNRQRIIGEYIVDFYCSKAKLLVELDNVIHNDEKANEYDSLHTQYMKKLGLQILSINNCDVFSNFKEVCKVIDTEVKRRIENSMLLG